MARSAWPTCLGAVAFVIAASFPAQAQTLNPSQIDSARQRVPAPLPSLPASDLQLLAPEKSAVPRAIDELEFEIKGVRVTGASVFDGTELEAMFAPLIGPRVKLSDLHAVAERIEERYRRDDYFLTRVFIPPQRLADGVLEVRVIEGFIGAVFVEGGNEANRERVEKLLARLTRQRPISLTALERAVLMANELPGISAAAVLRAGAAVGESELVLNLTDLSSSMNLSFNNAGADTTGKWGLSAAASVNNPLGFDGQIALGLNTSSHYKQTQSTYIRYSRALWQAGTTLSLGVVASQSRPGGTLTALEIKSDSISGGPRLRQALLRTRENSLYLDLALNINRSATHFLGFVQSADRTSVGESTVSWQSQDPYGSSQASLSYAQATGLLGAMGGAAENPSVAGFTPRFKKWSYSFTRAQKLPGRASAVFTLQTQDSNDILPSGEVASFGGLGIGRGYDSSAISGDRGAGALLELRHETPVALGTVSAVLQPYLFVDTAITTSNKLLTRQRLRSSGLGLRLAVGADAIFDLMVARAELPLATGGDSHRALVSGSLRF